MYSASQPIFAFILNGASMLLNFTSLQFPISSQVPHFFLLQLFTFPSWRSLSLVSSTDLALVKSF